MRYILAALISVCAFFAQAQQINPVPDYVFGNRMSVGRTSVTDTAAYFSIGPRYGAIRGMMPPMVVDTASVSGNKRNGLLIFSVQKNKFLYWDSVRVQWSDMAGSSGSYIVAGDTASMLLPYLRKADTTAMLAPYLKESDTVFLSNRVNLKVNIADTATMLAPYLKESDTVFLSNRINLKVNISDTSSMLTNYVRHAGYGLTKSGQAFLVDTAAMATRARVQKGIDSVAGLSRVTGSGTTNYLPKWTSSSALGNSNVYEFNSILNSEIPFRVYTSAASSLYQQYKYGSNVDVALIGSDAAISGGNAADFGIYAYGNNNFDLWTNNNRRLRIFGNGNIGIGTTTDAGYKTDIAGTLRSTLGANFATTSGNVGIGTASPSRLLDIQSTSSSAVFRLKGGTSNDQGSAIYYTFAGSTSTYMAIGDRAAIFGGKVDSLASIFTNSTIPLIFDIGASEKARFNTSGELLIGTTSDAGAYALQVSGSIYNTTGAVLAASSGNVGIGTASPSTILHLQGTSPVLTVRNNITASATQDSANNKTAGSLTFGANGSFEVVASIEGKYQSDASFGRRADLIFSTRSVENALTEKARLTSAGELLIGTTSDAGDYKLQINGNGYMNSLYLSSNTNAVIFGTNSAVNPYIQGDASNNLYLGTSNNPRVMITSVGEILLGTTTDAGDYRLQVNGNERIAGKLDVITTTEYGVNLGRSGTSATAFQAYNSTAAMAVGIESSAGGGLFTGTSAYAAVFGNANNYPTQFITNNAVRATITNTGRLGVGTTSPGYDIHAYQSATVAQIGVSASTNTGTYLQQATNGTGMLLNIDSARLYFGTDNATMMHLNPSGELIVNSEADNGDYKIQVNGNAVFYGTITTNQPTDGTARPWKLGEYVTTAPTATGYVQVEINGVKYKLLAATY